MGDQKEIDKLKEQYKSWSDSRLFTESRSWAAHSNMSIAAQQLLDERKQADDKAKQEREEARHIEIQNQLTELKKPHWTVLPIFIFSMISAFAGVIGCLLTYSEKRTTQTSTHESEKPSATQQQKKTELQQTILKPISSS